MTEGNAKNNNGEGIGVSRNALVKMYCDSTKKESHSVWHTNIKGRRNFLKRILSSILFLFLSIFIPSSVSNFYFIGQHDLMEKTQKRGG